MEDEGFLVRVGDGDRVVLGPDLIQLVRGADESGPVMELAREPLRELGEQVRETVTLSVVARDGQLDIVDQVDAPHQIRPGDWVGQRFPMHASSTGKILLASFDDARLEEVLSQPLARLTPATITQPKRLRDELARVRRRRYATTIDELEEGLSGVSVGVLAPGGSLVAVVNVTGPTQRLRRARLAEIAPTLRAFAERLNRSCVRGLDSHGLCEILVRQVGKCCSPSGDSVCVAGRRGRCTHRARRTRSGGSSPIAHRRSDRVTDAQASSPQLSAQSERAGR